MLLTILKKRQRRASARLCWMRLHVFAGENAILKFQACPKHSPLCQSCNSSNGQLAVGLSQSGLSYLYDVDPKWQQHIP